MELSCIDNIDGTMQNDYQWEAVNTLSWFCYKKNE